MKEKFNLTNHCAHFAIEYNVPQGFVEVAYSVFVVQLTVMKYSSRDNDLAETIVGALHEVVDRVGKMQDVSIATQARLYAAFIREVFQDRIDSDTIARGEAAIAAAAAIASARGK